MSNETPQRVLDWTVNGPTNAFMWAAYRISDGDLIQLGDKVVRAVEARPLMAVDGMYEVEVDFP